MYYLRKINNDVWFSRPALDSDCISDLRTINHEISVWKVLDDLSNINTMILTLAMTRDRLEDMYVCLMTSAEVEALNLDMRETNGASRYLDMNKEHTNIILPSLWELGSVAEYMHKLAKQVGQRVLYISEEDLREYLYNEVKSQKLAVDQVRHHKNIKKTLEEVAKVHHDASLILELS